MSDRRSPREYVGSVKARPAVVLTQLAVVCHELGDHDGARAALRQAMNSGDPNWPGRQPAR